MAKKLSFDAHHATSIALALQAARFDSESKGHLATAATYARLESDAWVFAGTPGALELANLAKTRATELRARYEATVEI